MNKELQKNLFGQTKDVKPFILGMTEEKVLSLIKNNNGKYLNFSALSNPERDAYIGVKRTTLISATQRLIAKGLIARSGKNVFILTNTGTAAQANQLEKYSANRIQASRNQLSVHKVQYKLRIFDDSKFTPSKLSDLNPISIEQNPSKNFSYQKIVKFNGATLVINKKSVFINIHDSLEDSALEGDYKAFLKAVDYARELERVGLKGSQLTLHDTHFARVETTFAKYLQKIDNKFFMELEDGTKYWVDKSLGVVEEESNNAEASENIKESMSAIISGKVDLNNLPFLSNAIKELTVCSASNTNILNDVSNKLNALTTVMSSVINANKNTAEGLSSAVNLIKKNLELSNKQPTFKDSISPELPSYVG